MNTMQTSGIRNQQVSDWKGSREKLERRPDVDLQKLWDDAKVRS